MSHHVDSESRSTIHLLLDYGILTTIPILTISLHGDVDNHLITSGWKNDQNGREVTDLPRFRGPYLTNLAQQQHVFGTRCTWVIAKHEEWLVTYAAYSSSKINSRNGKRGASYFDLLGNMEHDGLASPFL